MMNPSVQLVARGAPRFCVQVLPPQDAETMAGPIAELVTHLQLCLERPAPWYLREQASQSPVRLALRLCPERQLERETFEIVADADRVELAAATVAGLGHAVYYFLEQAFGVRWLWPGPSGTVAPRAMDVSWPIGIQRRSPAWEWRRLWLGGAFWGEQDPVLAELSRGGVSPATLAALRLWQRRNRLGGLNIADGHRWCQICPPELYGGRHPEYFALVNGQRAIRPGDGKHGNQPCVSNPEVVRLMAGHIVAQFKARPDLDGYSISINDGGGFCECPQCRALDEAEPAPAAESAFDRTTREAAEAAPAKAPPPRSITARMFRFANRVAEQVERAYPEKVLLMLVYSAYRTPPRSVRLHPKVIGQFCVLSWSHFDEAVRAEDLRLMQALVPVTTRRGIYDYFVNGVNGSLPRGFGRVFSRSLDAYYQAGCRFFATQAGLDFAVGGFNYYLAARRLWDMTLSPDEILRDYCRSGFGPGSEPARRYLLAFMERWEQYRGQSDGMETAAEALYPLPWRRERRRELEEAAAACAADAGARARVRFLIEGLDFLDLLVAAAEAILALKRQGAPALQSRDESSLRAWVGAAPDRQSIDRAVQCRRRLLDWVTAHQDGFWITAMWFQYQRLGRSGLLGAWMDVVAEALSNSGGQKDSR